MEILKFGKEIAQEISNYNSISAFLFKANENRVTY